MLVKNASFEFNCAKNKNLLSLSIHKPDYFSERWVIQYYVEITSVSILVEHTQLVTI